MAPDKFELSMQLTVTRQRGVRGTLSCRMSPAISMHRLELSFSFSSHLPRFDVSVFS